MMRGILFISVFLIGFFVSAQKPQRIAYIDMEYILENVPEYADAQSRLNLRVKNWQKKLDDIKREIEVLKTDLTNEKALLTDDLVKEREEDIEIKELDLKNLQAAYFGPTGDMYLLRKQLVKPVQDQIYNAVQEIAVRRKYDMILDKSSDLIMLYTNNKFDVSEQVLNRIVKGRKAKAIEEKRNERLQPKTDNEEALQTKIEQKEAKNEALQARIKQQQEARIQKREALKKAADEKRKKRLEEIEKRRKERESKVKKTAEKVIDSVQSKKNDSTTIKAIDSIAAKKLDEKAVKRAALKERARLAQEARDKKRQELIKAREEKRKKRLEELEKRKKKTENKEENNNKN